MRQKVAKLGIRMTPEEQNVILQAAKVRGYATTSAFARAALRNEISDRQELADAEQTLAATCDRMIRELGQLRGQLQALFALTDALTKAVLTCMPEPPATERSAAIATAKARYNHLIKTAAQSMRGASKLTLEELSDAPQG